MIFLDSASTTPLDPSVLEVMLPHMRGDVGLLGQAERSARGAAVRAAREAVAELLGCLSNEFIFTGGATEANNLAILGFASLLNRPGRIVSQVTEHAAVLEPLRVLEKRGWQVELLPVDDTGCIAMEAMKHALSRPTELVSIMWGNNEVGTLQPVAEIAKLCDERGVAFHCDAAQAVGKVWIDLSEIPISMLTLSAHKCYGPVGVGALYVRDIAKTKSIKPLMYGGGQEKGLRPGTLNMPGIVGLGAACRLARENLGVWSKHMSNLRARFESQLLSSIPDVSLNGAENNRLPHISNIAFLGVDNEGLLAMLPEIVAATGSACHFADFAPSHVLTALNKHPPVGECSLRFGFTKDSSETEIDSAAQMIALAVQEFREDAVEN